METSTQLRAVTVNYVGGEQITTSMAAGLTDAEISDYFKVGRVFNIGSGDRDKMAAVESIVIHPEKKDMDKLPAGAIDRFSIIRYEGKLWMLENRPRKPILIPPDQKCGIELSNRQVLLEVVMWPAQLAGYYLSIEARQKE